MAQSHDWFAPRSLVRFDSTEKRMPASRPCLPAVERLGDRVLLSAAPTTPLASVNPGPPQIPPGPCLEAYVNGLLGPPQTTTGPTGVPQTTNPIALDEFTIQKTTDQSSPKLFDAVNNEFYKLNDLFGGLDATLLTGTVTPDVVQDYSQAINAELLKIDTMLGGGTSTTTTATPDATVVLLPAVQQLLTDAGGLLTTLQGLAPGAGGASLKLDVQYLVLDASATDLSNSILKLNSDVLEQKMGSAGLDYLEYKLDEVFITSFAPPDPALKLDLQGALTEADSIVDSILMPTSPVGTSPTGGDT